MLTHRQILIELVEKDLFLLRMFPASILEKICSPSLNPQIYISQKSPESNYSKSEISRYIFLCRTLLRAKTDEIMNYKKKCKICL